MGADNWAYCPKCRVAAIQAKEKALDKADRAYGKKSAEEYATLLVEAEKPITLEQTLREDYGLGVGIDGIFGVDYKAFCKTCDFKYEFNQTKPAIAIADEYTEDAEDDNPFGYSYKRPFRV